MTNDPGPHPIEDIRALPDPALRATAAIVWRAACEIEDTGHEEAARLFYGLAHHFHDEAEHRQWLMANARIEIEWGGHLASARHDHYVGMAYARCHCGWRQNAPDGREEAIRLSEEHADETGGRYATVDLLAELYPPVDVESDR